MSGLRFPEDLAAWAQLAADLVNTRPRATDPPEKLVGVPELERLLARCPEPAPPVGPRDVARFRALREPLGAAFEAAGEAAFASAVNPLLGRGPRGWRMTPAGAGWELGPVAPAGAADWFGSRAARGLAELVIAYGIERLHVCAADDCLCAVVDFSRNNARRYCSRTCANRTNSRRHRRGG